MMEYIVKTEENLLNFLKNNLKNKSKNNIKKLISLKLVRLNNKVVTNPNTLLNINDKLDVIYNYIFDKSLNLIIPILFENKDILVVDKPCNILTISTESEKDRTLYKILRNYLNQKNEKIFIVHRLDKGTSGVILFAKNQKIKNYLQDNWNDIVINKEYLAITSSKIDDKGLIKSKLTSNKENFVYSSNKGKLAITKYKKIKSNKKYALLKVNIKTGRKNQIRVHLSELGFPIVGDKKYNSKVTNVSRVFLHSYKLEINIKNKKFLFISNIPLEFNNLILD